MAHANLVQSFAQVVPAPIQDVPPDSLKKSFVNLASTKGIKSLFFGFGDAVSTQIISTHLFAWG